MGAKMFFDNASTTKIDDKIVAQFNTINDKFFYNPGGLYSLGRQSKKFMEDCRAKILKSLNADGNLIFTGSATEANNLALFGLVKKNTRKI
jgi:cysteine desulfurase